MSHLLAPSLLASDFANLQLDVELVNASEAHWFHLDVMDGVFVPNISFGMPVMEAIARHAKKPLDVHLMIAPVDPYITAFAEAGAEIITFHPEAGPHPHRTAQAIRAAGCKVGISLNPATPVSVLDSLMGDIDLILVMSVNPGFGGQSFIESQLDKIKTLRAMIDASGRDIELEVDGGVNRETAAKVIAAGASMLVAGTATFQGGPEKYADNIAALRSAGA